MRKRFIATTLLVLAAVIHPQLVGFGHAQQISTKVLGIAVLNPRDAGFKADSNAFDDLITTVVPPRLGNTAIDRRAKIISMPINGDWQRDVMDPVNLFINQYAPAPRNKNTTLVFLFGGHGGTLLDPPAEVSLLSLDPYGYSAFYRRERLLKWIKEQKCRTTVFITDTCASAPNGESRGGVLAVQPPAAIDLFLKFSGTVDVQSACYRDPAKPAVILNEQAFSNKYGGLFSRIFFNQMARPRPANWTAFGNACTKSLRTAFQGFKAANPAVVPAGQTSQTAYFVVDGVPVQ